MTKTLHAPRLVGMFSHFWECAYFMALALISVVILRMHRQRVWIELARTRMAVLVGVSGGVGSAAHPLPKMNRAAQVTPRASSSLAER